MLHATTLWVSFQEMIAMIGGLDFLANNELKHHIAYQNSQPILARNILEVTFTKEELVTSSLNGI